MDQISVGKIVHFLTEDRRLIPAIVCTSYKIGELSVCDLVVFDANRQSVPIRLEYSVIEDQTLENAETWSWPKRS